MRPSSLPLSSVRRFEESPKPLTPKESKVLDFLTEYFICNGNSPSYQEIKDYFKLASFNSVQNYLKQLAKKNYIQLFPHQKRCIEIIKTSDFLKEKLCLSSGMVAENSPFSLSKKAGLNSDSQNRLLQKSLRDQDKALPSPLNQQASYGKSLMESPFHELPFLGRVAAGNPIERVIDNETMAIPPYLVKDPDLTYVLQVEGLSMIEEGINPLDFILVQEQSSAKNGDIVVASVENEATVKRIYFHPADKNKKEALIELRPSNKNMKSMFFGDEKVQIRGIVIGLIRKI